MKARYNGCKSHWKFPKIWRNGSPRAPIVCPGPPLEALALEGVRSGKLTTAQARRLLNIKSRYEMDGFLKAHGVLLPVTIDDVRRDGETALAFRK